MRITLRRKASVLTLFLLLWAVGFLPFIYFIVFGGQVRSAHPMIQYQQAFEYIFRVGSGPFLTRTDSSNTDAHGQGFSYYIRGMKKGQTHPFYLSSSDYYSARQEKRDPQRIDDDLEEGGLFLSGYYENGRVSMVREEGERELRTAMLGPLENQILRYVQNEKIEKLNFLIRIDEEKLDRLLAEGVSYTQHETTLQLSHVIVLWFLPFLFAVLWKRGFQEVRQDPFVRYLLGLPVVLPSLGIGIFVAFILVSMENYSWSVYEGSYALMGARIFDASIEMIVRLPIYLFLFTLFLRMWQCLHDGVGQVLSEMFPVVFRNLKKMGSEIVMVQSEFFYVEEESWRRIYLYFALWCVGTFLAGSVPYGGGLAMVPLIYVAARWLIRRRRELQAFAKGVEDMIDGNPREDTDVGFYAPLLSKIEELSTSHAKHLEEMVQNERMKTELISNVSHDLKTPLTALMNYATLLEREDSPEETKRYREAIVSQSGRVKKLLEDLIEMAKLSSHHVVFTPQSFALNDLMLQIFGEWEGILESEELYLHVNMPSHPIRVHLDPEQMSRVFDNLLENVRKYAQPKTRVYCEVHQGVDRCEILLRNTSKAMLNMRPEELMERFVRGDTSRNTEGSGLGLAIASSLVEQQGGRFDLEIEGDLFTVRMNFPLHREKRDS